MRLGKTTLSYIAVIIILSVLVFYNLATLYKVPEFKILLFWGMLFIITESLVIKLPNGIGVSVSFAISLACIIIHGPLAACLISCIGFAFRIIKVEGKGHIHLFNTPFYKTIFNISQSIIVVGVSGFVYVFCGGIIGTISLIPILLTLPVHVILNSVILSILFTLLTRSSFKSMWINNIKGTIFSSIAVGTVGIIIAMAYLSYGAGAVLLFFGPLLLARFSFKLYINMRNTYIETIRALNRFMEAKDAYTSGHALRVEEYAVKLAKAMKLSDKKVNDIKTAAILHDIGKIGIDDSILKKPSKLTEKEYKNIMQHPVIGAQILKDVDFLRSITEIIRHHHERYDGKGYPDGLKGNDISIETSILSLADVYDAMTSNRPYRKAMSKEEALKEIENNAGTQFDPILSQKFISIMNS